MTGHELPTVYDSHLHELVKLKVKAICEKQSVTFFNDIIFDQQGKPYSLRKTSVDHYTVPYTRYYASDKLSLKYTIPLFLNKLSVIYKSFLNNWTVIPEISPLQSWKRQYQQPFCQQVLHNYIINYQELIDTVYGLSGNK